MAVFESVSWQSSSDLRANVALKFWKCQLNVSYEIILLTQQSWATDRTFFDPLWLLSADQSICEGKELFYY